MEEWGGSFLAALEDRKNLVRELQGQRKVPGPLKSFPHFDPQRESRLFLQFQHPLKALSPRELLAFSLIMEAHASQNEDVVYPPWSLKIHIERERPGRNMVEMINPLLLKMVRPELFGQVFLTREFQDIVGH